MAGNPAFGSKPVGKGGCMISRVGQFKACPGDAVVTRFTGKVRIALCAKHDEKFGNAIGPVVTIEPKAEALVDRLIEEQWEREYWVVDNGDMASAVFRYSTVTRSWPVFNGKRGREYGGADLMSAKLVSGHPTQEQAQAEADRLNAVAGGARKAPRPPRVG